jgi:4-hydroxybenzoate polyprenyltransferase
VITYPLMKRITYWPQAVLGASSSSFVVVVVVPLGLPNTNHHF